MTHTTPTSSEDEAGARLRRDRPPEANDLDGQLHLAQLQQKLAGTPAEPVTFRQWDVERRLGHGGMGAVYLAKNRQLDRRVALKVLTRRSDADPSVREAQLVREARALATVHHRNVVQVHQVDTSAEPTVIEMEYIDGPTLRSWQVGRAWREVVEAYAGAGDGLAALHHANLIHRDVKPDNLLRGSDGHVKVADLGLAVTTPGAHSAKSAALHDIAAGGSFAGTPDYMAPEMIAQSLADEASDQFGLAASLFEALYGVLPFRGDTPEDLATAFRAGRPSLPPDAPRRPRWLREALERALAFNPDRRYPTVAKFTEALRSGLGRRRRWLLGALLTAVFTVPPVVAWSAKPPPPDPCASAGEPFTSLWTPAARAHLEQQAVAPPQLARSLERLSSTLDGRITALADTRGRLCAAERSLDPYDPSTVEFDLNARQHACLEHTRRNIAALVARLPDAGGPLAAGGYAEATLMVEALPACDNRQQFSQWPLPMPGRDHDADLAATLAHAAALEAAGQHDQAEQFARIVAESSRGQHPLRRAEALYRLGHILGRQRRTGAAITALDEARNLAFAMGYDELLCQAVAFQAKVSANVQLDAATSARELGLAEACLQRTGTRSLLLRADLLEARGLLALAAGDPNAAIRWHREALQLRQDDLGDEHLNTTKSLLNLANALTAAGQHAEARQRFHEALESRERMFGPDHVEVAHILFDLGNFLAAVDPGQAPPVLERAAAIYQRTPTALHAARAKIHLRLAIPHLESVPVPAPNLEAATMHIQQAHALLEEDQTLGPNHPTRASLLQAEGLLALRRGDFRNARQAYARATGLLRRHDPLSPEIVLSILMEIEPAYGLADYSSIAHHALNEGPALIAELKTRGMLAWYIGDSLIRQSMPEDAAPYLQIALDAYAEQSDAGSVAALRWALAQALVATPSRLEEARSHAVASLSYHQTAGDRASAATISRWLKRLASSPRPNQSKP